MKFNQPTKTELNTLVKKQETAAKITHKQHSNSKFIPLTKKSSGQWW